jgi:uncharacterized membrane protein YccC
MSQFIHQKMANGLKLNRARPPIDKMLQITLSSLIPMLIGQTYGHFGYSVFGALFSLAMTLNDHQGTIQKRIMHLFVCSFFLNFGLFLGAFFVPYQSYAPLFIFIVAIILGKIKDQGIALERMYLFSFFNFLAIFDTLNSKDQIYLPLVYSIIGFLSYLIILFILSIFFDSKTNLEKSKRDILISSLQNHQSNRFSLIYAVTVTISFYFFKSLNFKHSYWITGTILIVMLPSFSQSFDKSFQRIFGTILGVGMASIIMGIHQSPWLIFIGILAMTFFIPWTLEINYWLANVCIAGLVIFITEAQSLSLNLWSVSIERIIDISIGGFIAIFSNYFFVKKDH